MLPEREPISNGVEIPAGDALLAPSITRRFVERFAKPSEALARPNNTEVATLTTREREVLVLMARVLNKLGLRDRVQAVVLAYETGQ
jgi:DNA-binding NarL/FixJ family response regulator